MAAWIDQCILCVGFFISILTILGYGKWIGATDGTVLERISNARNTLAELWSPPKHRGEIWTRAVRTTPLSK